MACRHCKREMKIAARGLCAACYFRERKHGTLERGYSINKGRVCGVTGCEKAAFAKGMCESHYRQIAEHPARHGWRLLRSRAGEGGYPPAWDHFEAFIADVGLRPGPKHQLRRVHPDKPWSRENATWLGPIGIKKPSNWSVEDRAAYARAWNFRKKFGLTTESFEAMLAAQNGACAVCLERETHTYKSGRIRELAVDHCHTTGKIRGALCRRCNQGLGSFNDDPEILRRAIAYLERHKEKQAA